MDDYEIKKKKMQFSYIFFLQVCLLSVISSQISN